MFASKNLCFKSIHEYVYRYSKSKIYNTCYHGLKFNQFRRASNWTQTVSALLHTRQCTCHFMCSKFIVRDVPACRMQTWTYVYFSKFKYNFFEGINIGPLPLKVTPTHPHTITAGAVVMPLRPCQLKYNQKSNFININILYATLVHYEFEIKIILKLKHL